MASKGSVSEKPNIVVISSNIDLTIAKALSPLFSVHLSSWKHKDRMIQDHLPLLLLCDLDYCSNIKEELLHLIQKNLPDFLKAVIFYSGVKIQLVLSPNNGAIMQPIASKLSDPEIIKEFFSLLESDPLEHFHQSVQISYKYLPVQIRSIIDICCSFYYRIHSFQDLITISSNLVPEDESLFLNETELPFNVYLERLKIQMSIGIMINTDMSLKEISNLIGYKSHSDFTADFEKIQGISAHQFRKECMEKFENGNLGG